MRLEAGDGGLNREAMAKCWIRRDEEDDEEGDTLGLADLRGGRNANVGHGRLAKQVDDVLCFQLFGRRQFGWGRDWRPRLQLRVDSESIFDIHTNVVGAEIDMAES